MQRSISGPHLYTVVLEPSGTLFWISFICNYERFGFQNQIRKGHYNYRQQKQRVVKIRCWHTHLCFQSNLEGICTKHFQGLFFRKHQPLKLVLFTGYFYGFIWNWAKIFFVYSIITHVWIVVKSRLFMQIYVNKKIDVMKPFQRLIQTVDSPEEVDQ